VLERFTEPARQVVVLAQDEARELDFGVSSDAVPDGVVRALSGDGARVQLHGAGATAMPAMQRLRRQPRFQPSSALLFGWVLLAVALGVGIAIGWTIWG
jgi:hypothetical protein